MKAFPVGDSERVWEEGMDLRDYFAAQAMKHMALPLKGTRGDRCWNINEMDEFPYDGYANVAYKFADAMMKAREK